MDVVVDAGDHLLWCGVFLDIDVIVFEVAKETFRSNIVQSLSLAIHRNLHLADAQKIQIGRIGEMAALVGVDDLGVSVAESAPQAAQDYNAHPIVIAHVGRTPKGGSSNN